MNSNTTAPEVAQEQRVTNLDIWEALEILKAKYPNEKKLAVWVQYFPKGQGCCDPEPCYSYAAQVGESGDDAIYGTGSSLTAAIDRVIEKARDRDPRAKLDREIEATRAKLAKLYAERNPSAVAAEPKEIQ